VLITLTALCIVAAPLRTGKQKSRLLYLHATAVVAADHDANWASLTMTRIGTAWWSVALLMLATMQAAAEPRRVLMLHAFGHAYSPWSDMAGSFPAELIKRSSEPIDLYEVSLDTARVQDPKDEGPFVEYIRAVLAGRKLDLIVPVGAPAAFFMQRYRQQLFPTTSMLTVGADVRRISNATRTEHDAAVLLDLDLPAYLRNILNLRPETREIAVVVGNSPVERYWTSELRRDFQPFADRVKITWFNDLTFGDMLERAATMPPQSAIFWFCSPRMPRALPIRRTARLKRCVKSQLCPFSVWATMNCAAASWAVL
jgi:hypothetical protein